MNVKPKLVKLEAASAPLLNNYWLIWLNIIYFVVRNFKPMMPNKMQIKMCISYLFLTLHNEIIFSMCCDIFRICCACLWSFSRLDNDKELNDYFLSLTFLSHLDLKFNNKLKIVALCSNCDLHCVWLALSP